MKHKLIPFKTVRSWSITLSIIGNMRKSANWKEYGWVKKFRMSNFNELGTFSIQDYFEASKPFKTLIPTKQRNRPAQRKSLNIPFATLFRSFDSPHYIFIKHDLFYLSTVRVNLYVLLFLVFSSSSSSAYHNAIPFNFFLNLICNSHMFFVNFSWHSISTKPFFSLWNNNDHKTWKKAPEIENNHFDKWIY